jgi:metal-responsive CopG/Arc/MetJ family transcriptional regulator
MATVNFSVPEELKQKFNKVFAGTNKSQVIAELMMRAVEERGLQKRRVKAMAGLLKLRGKKPSYSDAAIRAAREYGRP